MVGYSLDYSHFFLKGEFNKPTVKTKPIFYLFYFIYLFFYLKKKYVYRMVKGDDKGVLLKTLILFMSIAVIAFILSAGIKYGMDWWTERKNKKGQKSQANPGNYYGGVGDEQKLGILDKVRSLVGLETSVAEAARLAKEYEQKKAAEIEDAEQQYADDREYQGDTNHAIKVNKERKAATENYY